MGLDIGNSVPSTRLHARDSRTTRSQILILGNLQLVVNSGKNFNKCCAKVWASEMSCIMGCTASCHEGTCPSMWVDIFNPICTCTAAGINTRVCLSWTIYVVETPGGKLILTTPGIFYFLANGSFFFGQGCVSYT